MLGANHVARDPAVVVEVSSLRSLAVLVRQGLDFHLHEFVRVVLAIVAWVRVAPPAHGDMLSLPDEVSPEPDEFRLFHARRPVEEDEHRVVVIVLRAVPRVLDRLLDRHDLAVGRLAEVMPAKDHLGNVRAAVRRRENDIGRDQTASAEVPDVILQRGDVGVVGIRLCPSDDPAFSVASSQHLPGRRAREDELETNERSFVHHGVSWYGGIVVMWARRHRRVVRL
mmetsp:Transcript_5801/g.12283  ORF Transcript_5801/g.12283 Transcript_5801/m.12283 type:complete len:225 (-) Transcript_5801:156-830(-)